MYEPNELHDETSYTPQTEYVPAAEPKKPPKTGRRLAAIALVAALTAGTVGGAVGYRMGSRPAESTTDGTEAVSQLTMTQQPAHAATSLADNGLELAPAHSDKLLEPADVYAQNVDAVVAINTEGSQNVWGQATRFAASGSGFIITKDGYVVTNHHVIENATTITVTLTSGESYPAELIGSDEENDVALLKIDAADLPVVSIGDSDDLQVGAQVAAIGNPLGELTNTLTVGYVSALDREINTDGTPINMLQTDAAINSGNSGGPLFDMYGNVIGITTAKYASSTVEGLGFAIPINDAMKIVADLKMYGYVIGRPYFGVYTDDLTVTMASYYNLPVGVYVTSVVEGAAADKAGLQGGDIICSIDGKRCQTQTELSSIMKQYSAGDTAQVEIYRSGEYRTVPITFDEKPKEDAGAQQTTPSTGSTGGQSRFPFFGFGYGG